MFLIVMREFRGTSLRLSHAYFAKLKIKTLRSTPWACKDTLKQFALESPWEIKTE